MAFSVAEALQGIFDFSRVVLDKKLVKNRWARILRIAILNIKAPSVRDHGNQDRKSFVEDVMMTYRESTTNDVKFFLLFRLFIVPKLLSASCSASVFHTQFAVF